MRLHSPRRASNGWLPLALCWLIFNQTAPGGDSPTLKDTYKPHFLMGTAINRSFATGTGFRRTPDQVAQDVALVKAQFNQVTAENDMKWGMIHPRPGADGYDFRAADAFVDFAVKNNMTVAGHTLVWHSQTPDWVFRAADAPASAQPQSPGMGFPRSFTGPRASRGELLQRMREHINTVVGRYRGRIKVWDVVNEALADGGPDDLRKSLWLEIIGPDFIDRAFEYAHEADPDAVLRYNDYGLENPDKRRRLVSPIRSLRERKVPIHAIGTQTHVNLATTFEVMDQTLTEIAALELPIHITELDVNSAEAGQQGTGAEVGGNASITGGGLVNEAARRQADTYAGLFRAFLKHDKSVEIVTLWGSNDALSWRRQGRPLLFDGENKPKPAWDAVIRNAEENSKSK